MTEKELNTLVAELAVLDHEATPAPWTHSFLGSIIAANELVVQGGWLLAGGMAGVQSDVEAELIVKARNALPELLSALQNARMRRAEAEGLIGVERLNAYTEHQRAERYMEAIDRTRAMVRDHLIGDDRATNELGMSLLRSLGSDH